MIPRSAGTRVLHVAFVDRNALLRRSSDDGYRLRWVLWFVKVLNEIDARLPQSTVIPVNVVCAVHYFAPFSHPHRAIAPAVFEITIGQAMHGLELVVFRL